MSSRIPLRALVADPHEVVREGVRVSLAREGRIAVVGVAGSGRDAIAAAARLRPDVALVDLELGDLAGETVCRRIRALDSGRTRVVLTARVASADRVRAAVEAGAFAYVAKADGLWALRDALERVLVAHRLGSDPDPNPAALTLLRALRREAARTDRPGLSPHQRRVLDLATEGLTDREIGRTLCISESTVRYHLQRLKTLLGARSKVELVRRAYEAGLAGQRGALVPPLV